MAEVSPESPSNLNAAASPQAPLPAGWLAQWPWGTFLLPMIVFMVLGSLDPTPPPQLGIVEEISAEASSQQTLEPSAEEQPAFFNYDSEYWLIPPINYSYYPHVYTGRVVVTLLTMLLVWPGYRTFPFRVSWLSVVVGVVGVVLWVAICHLRLEPKIIGPIDAFLGRLVAMLPGLGGMQEPSIGLMAIVGTGERSAFNPLEQLASTPTWSYVFLGIRFVGLALIVPVIEEFFLRGFLMRSVIHEKWWQVPFGTVNRMAVIAGTAVPMLMHPGELFAAFVWFSLITWLMVRTRNIWDCVVAHAVTNFLLGVYVVWFDQWQLM